MIVMKGINEAIAAVKNIERQKKFIFSLAINETLKDAQEFTTGKILPETFTLRKRASIGWWAPRQRFGFNIRFSNKSNLQGTLGSRADWLRMHEHGGIKTASGRIAIPSDYWKPKESVLKKAKRPRPVAQAAKAGRKRQGVKPFITQKGIFARVGGGVKSLFTFIRSARINKTLHFEKRAKAYALKRLPIHFKKAFDRAMRTARK